MLIGQYYTKVSSKGRTAIPARFRKELGSTVVISRWYEKSLAVFGQRAWKKVLDLAVGDMLLTRPIRDTERFLLGGAYELELDAQGRLVLPSPLREYAQISTDIVFIGLGERIEVWNKDMWVAKEADIIKQAGELIEDIQRLKKES